MKRFLIVAMVMSFGITGCAVWRGFIGEPNPEAQAQFVKVEETGRKLAEAVIALKNEVEKEGTIDLNKVQALREYVSALKDEFDALRDEIEKMPEQDAGEKFGAILQAILLGLLGGGAAYPALRTVRRKLQGTPQVEGAMMELLLNAKPLLENIGKTKPKKAS